MGTQSEPSSSVTNLPKQLTGLTKQANGLSFAGNQLQLSPQAAQNWMNMFQAGHDQVAGYLQQVSSIKSFGNVGTLASANDMVQLFHEAVGQTSTLLTDYKTYFDTVAGKVNSAFNKFVQQDQALDFFDQA